MLISAGNTDNFSFGAGQYLERGDPADNEIQAPVQAWNALAVGAFTQKVGLPDEEAAATTALAPFGDFSPFSRTASWSSHRPLKPDVVLEGGNWASSACPVPMRHGFLSLLLTHHNYPVRWLTFTYDTSAATALAGRTFKFNSTVKIPKPSHQTKGKSGRLFCRPRQHNVAATVAEYCSADYTPTFVNHVPNRLYLTVIEWFPLAILNGSFVLESLDAKRGGSFGVAFIYGPFEKGSQRSHVGVHAGSVQRGVIVQRIAVCLECGGIHGVQRWPFAVLFTSYPRYEMTRFTVPFIAVLVAGLRSAKSAYCWTRSANASPMGAGLSGLRLLY
jgi:hypothetical protein